MKVLMSLGIVITLSLIGGSVEAKAAGCEAIGNVRFICDQLGPEDLAAVPGSDWVLASGMAANGAIRLINLRDKSTTVLFPSTASTERPNKKTYESCPGPIGSEGDKFRAHGLYLRPGQSAVHTLYVVHHGGRESIEVFEFDARTNAPTLTWIGCAVAPDPIGLNSVVGLSDGGFITTNFLPRGTDSAARERMMAGEINGEVWEWRPDTGWKVWRSPKTVSGCTLADGAAILSFACRAGKRLSRGTVFRLAFVSTISDGPRTARCLPLAREGLRLRRHRTL
jgi:hypothetical protein